MCRKLKTKWNWPLLSPFLFQIGGKFWNISKQRTCTKVQFQLTWWRSSLIQAGSHITTVFTCCWSKILDIKNFAICCLWCWRLEPIQQSTATAVPIFDTCPGKPEGMKERENKQKVESCILWCQVHSLCPWLQFTVVTVWQISKPKEEKYNVSLARNFRHRKRDDWL